MKHIKKVLAALLLLTLLSTLLLPALADTPHSGTTAQMELIGKKKKTTPTPAPTATPTPEPSLDTFVPTPVPEGPITDPQSIADYLFAHGELPENFITKKEARKLGWDSSVNYVSDVAPGKSIGGDYFGNYEERLPVVEGRSYYEADCWYTEGRRNAYRVIYSTDGHVWYTGDHYVTFVELFPTGTEGYTCPVTPPKGIAR